jgi:hypothetical protein
VPKFFVSQVVMSLEEIEILRVDAGTRCWLVTGKSKPSHLDRCFWVDIRVQETLDCLQLLILQFNFLQLIVLLLDLCEFLVHAQHLLELCIL